VLASLHGLPAPRSKERGLRPGLIYPAGVSGTPGHLCGSLCVLELALQVLLRPCPRITLLAQLQLILLPLLQVVIIGVVVVAAAAAAALVTVVFVAQRRRSAMPGYISRS